MCRVVTFHLRLSGGLMSSTIEAPASQLPLPMQNVLSRLAANSTEAEQALVRKAYTYAAAAHAGPFHK